MWLLVQDCPKVEYDEQLSGYPIFIIEFKMIVFYRLDDGIE